MSGTVKGWQAYQAREVTTNSKLTHRVRCRLRLAIAPEHLRSSK
jgi:hypothetical protein